MDTSIIEIAERIKGLRELSDYTPEEVAEAVNVPLEKYLEYDEGKLIAASKMQKYVFSSRISDFKKIYYELKQKDFLPPNVDELDSYIPINFDKRR